jgi:multidrug efflux pump subunit AcrA (membrane-fusion protein)
MALTKKKKIIIAVTAVAVLALVVIISDSQPQRRSWKYDSQVDGETQTDRSRVGEVRPIRYIKLTSEVPGRIEEIYVNAGDQVTQGKPLVHVTPAASVSQEAQWAAARQSTISERAECGFKRAAGTGRRGSSVASARQQLVALQTRWMCAGRSKRGATRTEAAISSSGSCVAI